MRSTVPFLLASASAVIVCSALVPGTIGEFLLAAGVAAFPGLLIALAAGPGGRRSPRIVPAAGLVLLLGATLAALLWLDRGGDLPPGLGLLLMLAGLWLAPLVLVAVTAALRVDDAALGEEALARLRRMARRAPER